MIEMKRMMRSGMESFTKSGMESVMEIVMEIVMETERAEYLGMCQKTPTTKVVSPKR